MYFNELSYTALYLNITYCHTYYDVRILPCVLSVTSLWRQTVWDELYHRIIDKAIKLWRTSLIACVEAKGGHFEHKKTLKTSSEWSSPWMFHIL